MGNHNNCKFVLSDSIAEITEVSVLESKALVASSKTIFFEFLYKALAIAILCLCPPLILYPFLQQKFDNYN